MLNNLKPTKGARHTKHRIGRGPGSGWGETSGKGFNGQLARSGGGPRPGFEGGQIPFFQRIPKRGFTNINRKEFACVNLNVIEELFSDGDVVNPSELLKRGILSKLKSGLKILGDGDLTKKVTIQAHKFSASALEKINKSGSSSEVL
ncbi:MAG: 50S ribosomal protein L15 [Acholeplasmatales bacterium]|jgi:large subunit ribosomal protein L15|nr:50S ribosomal protein L15 [Acholeplasmatales bacterium]